MRKLALFLAVALAAFSFPGALASAEEDAHFIESDNYFIADEAFKNQDWIYVHLAKMLTKATVQTKMEAEFIKASDGTNTWTKYYWKTTMASKADLRPGTEVIVFEKGDDKGIYQGPENSDEAKTGSWFMARITDISNLYKGYVILSGGYKAGPASIRVLLRR